MGNRAFQKVASQPWAITEDYLTVMLEIAARENLTPEAVEKQLGRPLDNSRTSTTRDGIATIPVDGPMFRGANMFTQISGGTSINSLAKDFNTALNDQSVKGILLAIDSPGGEVNGTSEFAQMVYDARGKKSIIAYVSDLGCSAAYWIASAADEIVVADTARVGSIGVISAVPDPNAASAREIQFVSSQSPMKRPDPTTKDGKAEIQRTVDALGEIFVGTVARNRGVSADTVLSDFGRGGVYVGQAAVDAGLADRVGSYESVLADMMQQSGSGNGMLHANAYGWTPPVYATGANTNWNPAYASGPNPVLNGITFVGDTFPTVANTTPEENIDMPNEDKTGGADMTALMEQLEAQRLENQKAAERIAELERESVEREERLLAEARRREFAEIAADFAYGSTDEHVAIMEALPVEMRSNYVQVMRAVTAQGEASTLFKAAGVAGEENDGNPVENFSKRQAALMKSDGVSATDAAMRLAAEDPQLYREYRAATSNHTGN